MDVSHVEEHRTSLGDLLGFVEVRTCQVQLALHRTQPRAGKESTRLKLTVANATKTIDRRTNMVLRNWKSGCRKLFDEERLVKFDVTQRKPLERKDKQARGNAIQLTARTTSHSFLHDATAFQQIQPVGADLHSQIGLPSRTFCTG